MLNNLYQLYVFFSKQAPHYEFQVVLNKLAHDFVVKNRIRRKLNDKFLTTHLKEFKQDFKTPTINFARVSFEYYFW